MKSGKSVTILGEHSGGSTTGNFRGESMGERRQIMTTSGIASPFPPFRWIFLNKEQSCRSVEYVRWFDESDRLSTFRHGDDRYIMPHHAIESAEYDYIRAHECREQDHQLSDRSSGLSEFTHFVRIVAQVHGRCCRPHTISEIEAGQPQLGTLKLGRQGQTSSHTNTRITS